MNQIISNEAIFCGPFLGEFGWELMHWLPHLRWLKNKMPGKHFIASSYPDRKPLYAGIIDEFISLPGWFLSEKYDCDCFEALCSEKVYGELLNYFIQFYTGRFSKVLEHRTPRGLHFPSNGILGNFVADDKGKDFYNEIISKYNHKPCVIVFARDIKRKKYLNCFANTSADIDESIPLRNWGKSNWEKLFKFLYDEYKDKIVFAIGGTSNGNCLDTIKKDIINLIDVPINKTIAFLNNALCSISSQGGSTLLSNLSGCKGFVYGHEKKRHTQNYNPLNVEIDFFETDINNYNTPPELIFRQVKFFIDKLLSETPNDKEPLICSNSDNIKDQLIKSVGVVGVFNELGGTNIGLAKAFEDSGYIVERLNYRTIQDPERKIKELSNTVDLLVICKGSGISIDTYQYCTKNTITCWYMMDSAEHLISDERYIEYAKICDLSIVTAKEVKDYIERVSGIIPLHEIQGISPDEYYPIQNIQKSIDILFIGTRSKKRDNILNSLDNINLNRALRLEVYGNGYTKEVNGDDFNRACASAKICLAINNTSPDQDSFSDRIIRYMATKALVVTEYSKNIEAYFENYHHLIWFKSNEELKQIIENILGNKIDIQDIAENGYKKVLAEHTWNNVVKKIIEGVKNVKKII